MTYPDFDPRLGEALATINTSGNLPAMPKAAYVSLQSSNPNLTVSAILDENQPKVSGFGGWVEIARPKRIALVDWTGISPIRLAFGMMLDAWGDGPRTVEQECLNLERMSRPGPQNQKPPTVKIVEGELPHMDKTFVIEVLDWGDCIRQRETGKRVRQVVSLTLLSISDSVASSKKSPANAARSAAAGRGGQAHPTSIRVKAGQTLSEIAAANYGDASKWKDIATANGIRDPKNLKVNQVLKLP